MRNGSVQKHKTSQRQQCETNIILNYNLSMLSIFPRLKFKVMESKDYPQFMPLPPKKKSRKYEWTGPIHQYQPTAFLSHLIISLKKSKKLYSDALELQDIIEYGK